MRECQAPGCDNPVADEAYCPEHTPDITPEMMADVELKGKELYFKVFWKGEYWKAHYIRDDEVGGGWRLFDPDDSERTDGEAEKIIKLVEKKTDEVIYR